MFFATVFNAEQIEGLPPIERREQTWNPIERAEQILLTSGATVHHGEYDRAFYRPSTDSIHLPDKEQFPTADNYYATALHELGHWTGHESRLSRDLVHPFGSEGYAKEELRAEIASMILGDAIGIGHDTKQHAAYVNSWIKVLQDDPLEIFRAAADAEKIQDFVLGLDEKLVQDESAQMGRQNAASAEQAPVSAVQNATEVDMGIPREGMDADGATLRVEAWTVARVEQGTLLRALDQASPEQVEKMRSVLQAMSPVDAENPFWQRHALPADGEATQEKIERASEAAEQRLVDAPLAAARLGPPTGRAYGRERGGDADELARESEDALGFPLPADWNGRVRVDGFGTETLEGEQVFTTLLPKGARPDGWGVFAQHVDGGFAMLASFGSEREADELAERLALIDAHSTATEHEKAAKLARNVWT
uniref:ArdC family protein n=1 Tax=Rugamonas fusca TaxID=2758568 RepID=UPI0035CD0389